MMRSLHALVVLAAVGVVAGCPVAAHAQASLSGETLRSTSIDGAPTCGSAGATDSFSISGQVEFGPYFPGSFTEQGTASGDTNGLVTGFDASFTITPDPADPDPTFTRITGTKRLVKSEGTASLCIPDLLYGIGILGNPLVDPLATYEAIIETPTGTCKSSGATQVQFRDSFPGSPIGDDFAEQFFSLEPCKPIPTTKDECKDGGWTAFSGFKNEGDCVSFLATEGNNQPGG